LFVLYFALRIFWTAASTAKWTASGAPAGLAGSVVAFTATNLLINRFDSVEGAAFVGTMIGSALLVTLTTTKAAPAAGLQTRLDAVMT
jgi:hypothetical protein